MEQKIDLLSGSRFHKEANKVYKVPVDELPKRKMFNSKNQQIAEEIDFENETVIKMIVEFIQHHETYQVPRLKQLERYYQAENNIKYRNKKAEGRADNRIASDFAKFIVKFKQGILLGNPLKYTGDKAITKKVDEFSKSSNEDYHNQLMARDMFTFGRAYEWIGRDEYGKETLSKFDVQETFVIYDASKNKNSVCAVNYYDVEFLDKTTMHVDVYACDGFVYKFKTERLSEDMGSPVAEQSYFDAVQVNEWINNEERTGDFESVLDSIDAYDLSRSEMANFQQDSSEAYLVIQGNPDTGEDDAGDNSESNVLQDMIKARMLVLGDKKIYEDGQAGTDPKAYYLKKEYDTQGVESNDSRTVADILRFTSLIDFTDENIGSNQSGIGFRFKGWGSDNDRKNKERMIKKAIMRRLRLLTYSWNLKDDLKKTNSAISTIKNLFKSEAKQQEQLYEKVNDIEILFTPNVPQSDEEIMSVISGMDGIVSEQTLFEMTSRLTGVSADEEIKRIKKEFENKLEPSQHDVDKSTETEEVVIDE